MSNYNQLVQSNLLHLKEQGAFHQFIYQPCDGFGCYNYAFMNKYCSKLCEENNMYLYEKYKHCEHENCHNMTTPWHFWFETNGDETSICWYTECIPCCEKRSTNWLN